MGNVIYNELIMKKFYVDIGVVTVAKKVRIIIQLDDSLNLF